MRQIEVYRSAEALLDKLSRQPVGAVGIIERETGYLVVSLTAFGPSVRSGSARYTAREVAMQTLNGDAPSVAFAPSDWGLFRTVSSPDLGEFVIRCEAPSSGKPVGQVIDAFESAAKAKVIEKNTAGAATSRVIARAPVVKSPIQLGEILIPAISTTRSGKAIAWRAGAEMIATHLLLSRDPSPEEISLVAASKGIVRDFVHFTADPSQSNSRFQVLSIEVPSAFAIAFPDGKVPVDAFRGASVA